MKHATDPHGDFYIGYLPDAPEGTARFLRPVVLLTLLVALAVAAVALLFQSPFAQSRYEYGFERSFEGTLIERPVPALIVARPGRSGAGAAYSTYPLVLFGKHGGASLVAGRDGRDAKLRGMLIYRDDRTMIEVLPETLEVAETGSLRPDAPIALGPMTLDGEVVDSKCYLGVMKPGNLKPHRSCAVRCIAGGVPPVLLVRDPEGFATYLLLVDPDGGPLGSELLDIVADPVRVRGRVERQGDLLILRTSRDSITVLDGERD